MYRFILKPLFFLFDPEKIHYFIFNILSLLFKIPLVPQIFSFFFCVNSGTLHKNVFGLTFKNPVGLAAGFDKNARYLNLLPFFGFGFIEIGTVTPLPQNGNPRPRLFRLPKDESLLNRMGFNNDGADAIAKRLSQRDLRMIVGANIGKNKATPNENAISDYEICFLKLHAYVDYFAINVSSPNTPGLRSLQEREPLRALLSHLMDLNKKTRVPKPILLKISPDLSNAQIDDVVEIVLETGIHGVIATNTTIDQSSLKTSKTELEILGSGGFSGKVVRTRSTEVIRLLSNKSNGRFPIIGVGGIHSSQDAHEKFIAGASLIQVYSGWIYSGPNLISKILRSLIKPMLKNQ